MTAAAQRWGMLVLIGLGAILSPMWAHAQDLQSVPALVAHVIDQTGTLTGPQAQALESKLTNLEHTLGSQVVILMIPSTTPEDIASYAQRVGDSWKIGRKEVGDGLIVVVAKQDHRVRIEVAKTLEGPIPDLAAKQIIDRVITPAFKTGDFAGGLNAGVDQIAARIKGENLPMPNNSARKRGAPSGFSWENILVFGLIGIPIISGVISAILGRKAGSLVTGLIGGGLVWLVTSSILLGLVGWLFAAVLSLAFGNSGGGRGGWGGPPMGGGWGTGSGGGGGFSSGGGGDFGGGGASGNW